MKFLPKVVKSKLRLVRFLKNKLNVAKKSLHVAKFIAKSMISSKGKIKESLLIRDLKPALNENVGSDKLHLYYYIFLSF